MQIDLDFITLFDEEKSLNLKKNWAKFQTAFLKSAFDQAGTASKAVQLLLNKIENADNPGYFQIAAF